MKLYSYQYLTHNSHLVDYVFVILGLIIGIGIIFLGVKYAKNRSNLKYRNILIVMFAFAAMLICLAVGKLQTQASTQNDSGQIARIMKSMSYKHHVPISEVYTSSPTINKELVLKVSTKYYQININSTTDVYSSKTVHPFTNHIQYIQHGGLNLNVNNIQYFNIAGKLLIGFIMLVLQINLSGKGNLDPSNAVDELQNYVLGGIVGGTVFNLSISVLEFIVIILIWTVIIFGSKILIDQSNFFKVLMNGSPKVLINQGKINVSAAIQSGISASQLFFKLNNAGINDLNKIDKVTLEQNGELNISSYKDTTNNLPVITDGNINQDVLNLVHKDRQWLMQILASKHHQVNDVYLGQIINDHDLALTLYPQKTSLLKYIPNQIIHFQQMIKRKH